jgi:alkylated DNA repair dioxygenase AlkB
MRPQPAINRIHGASYSDVVDLDRYPIGNLEGAAGRALIDRCRQELLATGVCVLPGFLTPGAVSEMVKVAEGLSDRAWASDEMHTVYFDPVESEISAPWARSHEVRSAKRGIAYDYIPKSAPIRRLYESEDMTRFIGSALDKEVLYRSSDPLDALQITIFQAEDELGWHFDRSEFSVTVMYQQPEGGGDFEYLAALRSSVDENYRAVEEVLRSRTTSAVRLPAAPGTLALFRGHHALHRVTPVIGLLPRINSVLTYGERPDMRLNDLTSALFYGRTSSLPREDFRGPP